MKRRIDGLKAINSFRRYIERRDRELAASRPGTTSQITRDKHENAHPDIVHPLVRTHPITGRKCLYIADGTTVVGNTLQHVKGCSNVERARAERDAGDVGANERPPDETSLGQTRRRQVEGEHAAMRPEQQQVVAGSGAAVDQPQVRAAAGDAG